MYSLYFGQLENALVFWVNDFANSSQPILPACWLLTISLKHECLHSERLRLFLDSLYTVTCSKAALAASEDGLVWPQVGEAVFIKF